MVPWQGEQRVHWLLVMLTQPVPKCRHSRGTIGHYVGMPFRPLMSQRAESIRTMLRLQTIAGRRQEESKQLIGRGGGNQRRHGNGGKKWMLSSKVNTLMYQRLGLILVHSSHDRSRHDPVPGWFSIEASCLTLSKFLSATTTYLLASSPHFRPKAHRDPG